MNKLRVEGRIGWRKTAEVGEWIFVGDCMRK